ncbi:ABC transporter permease [Streptomyces diastaticus]|uniref:Oligopeptide transport system permease protein OppB n=1 Tax=Streptomyces griseus TaxID=1911 RepID=A0A380MVE5_STRGR|nr:MULTISPECIES: ABC transporter permease [Streptomyces]MDQ0292849.1 peptide/nickel transport system permease protein [Streptomyces sp. DSM 41037]WPR53580.1 ABC transporter permease [Streptomyces sp. S399]GFH68009.1 ABC transporter permease [Streptomyces rutgersensis]SUO96560.1 Oligopeptide transport system permease protein OppB [Streptomyces griseus]
MSTDSTAALVKSPGAVPDGPAETGPSGRGPRSRSTAAYLRYVAGKLAGAAVSLFAVLVTSFFLFRMIPGDPVKHMTQGRPVSTEQLAAMRREFGLDLPMWQQFTDYCGKALTGDFGMSYQFRAPVIDKVAEALPATLLLTGTAFVLYTVLGIWLGARSAWRSGKFGDRFSTAFALTLYSVPSFWLGLLLIITLSVGVGPIPGMFPTGGMESGGQSGFGYVLDVAHHMVLPVLTLVAVEYARTLLVMRSSLLDEMGSDYLTTARAKGLRDDAVRRRHAVPNALLPTVTLLFVNLGNTVAGAILVETVFSWPGLGGLFYQALSVPDLPLVQGLFFLFAAAVILMNTLADVIYPLLDPRVGR